MMTKSTIYIVALVVLGVSSGFGQKSSYSWGFEQQEDPAYMLYKTGYNLVLQSKWKDAERKFEDVVKFYPKSSYLDDASYWYAYCLKYQDERKAVNTLRKFLREFPRSSYRSDALEDLAELQARIQRNIPAWPDSVPRGRIHVQIPDIQVKAPTVNIYQDWDWDFPGDRFAVSVFSDEMQDEMEWGLMQPWFSSKYKDLDENTRLKISALRGIAADRDTESFQTVRDLVLDRSENPRLREEALRLLSRYEELDILPTLKNVAKTDPEPRLRHGAIYYIGKFARDKEAAASSLIDLYNSTPKDSARLKERLLYSIARTGTGRGSDFLVTVAKSGEDYRFRESALYWLGKYGEGKKKKALYEILKRK